MNVFDFIRAPLQWAFCLVANIVFDLMGLVVVAVAIPFAGWERSVSDNRLILNLPHWAHLWGNDFDGLLGDKRLWWAANTPFGWDVNGFMAKYWWAAIRNPSNNMRMYSVFQAPIAGSTITHLGDYDVADRVGGGGWQFVKLVTLSGRKYYGFYLVWEYSTTRAFVIRLGFKISPDHQGTQELPKGETIRINPWATL